MKVGELCMMYAALIETLENVMEQSGRLEALTMEEKDLLVDHLHEVCRILDKVA